MKTTSILFIFLAGLLLFACQSESTDAYSLVKTGESLTFPLEPTTKNALLFLAPYTDTNGKEYLTFQNQTKNEIWFYDMESRKAAFRLTPALDGANGVGRFLGYYIHTLDSIYLTNYDFQEIALIDTGLTVRNKWNYEQAQDGTPLSFFCFVTHTYRPATVIGRKMYLYSGPDRFAEKAPVTTVMDMDTESIEALPFQYLKYPGEVAGLKKFGFESEYSRCFDGTRFLYSFYFDEDIYVANPAHDSVYRVRLKSKYIPKVKLLNDVGVSPEEMCESPKYGNLLYDPYREVYYRIAWPSAEMDKNVRAMELMKYGRKRFSILIIDKELKVIGETLFPDYTYNPKLALIRPDGLYLSDSHYMNPDFSDDVLSFQKFELKKTEKTDK